LAELQVDLQAIGNLLQIEQDVRQADSISVIEFIAANDSWRIVPYRQAVLWRCNGQGQARLQLVSGLADVAADSPFRQWLNQVLDSRTFVAGNPQVIAIDDLPPSLRSGWREWMPPQVVAVPFRTPLGSSNGGLWLALESTPSESELALLARLSLVYGQGLWAWRDAMPLWQRLFASLRQLARRKWWWLALLALACIPMRLTVLAPAEIIGKDARLIAAPGDGVVAHFFVTPNQQVASGAPLFVLDDTNVRNRNEVAGKSRAVAEAEYLRATQKSFTDQASKAELSGLKARLEEKAAEADYTRDLFERGKVNAPDAGIVIFSDPNDWLGRPVQTGERIMQLADPKKVQIAIHLAVDDALNLEPGADVRLYLNIAPLQPLQAHLVQASYEPAAVAEGFVAYQLKADLQPGDTVPRIGLKGTAKIYGDWAPLIYHVLRKPLAWLRRSAGV
jgi:multidrug resistance efflux pump